MSDNCRAIGPIPETFSSYEEAAEFWDTHDTTDYLDDFKTVAVDFSNQQTGSLNMKLEIKSIVNGLFSAKINHEQFEATAVGYTKDEATQKALEWLKREIEIFYQWEEKDPSKLEEIEYELEDNNLELQSGDFLNDDIWKGLDEEIRQLALKVMIIALKASLKSALISSTGGSLGGLGLFL